MKILLDDKTTRGYDLNANEACIFAAILKCTRAGRGWYGNYRELAAAMPFVMSYKTANRAVQKLLTLGLIVERDNALFTNNQSPITDGQIVPNDGQIVHENGQIVQESGQIVLPPNNPPIINNNMNEKQLSSPAQDARTEEKKTENFLDFKDFWASFIVPVEYENRKNACRNLWATFSDVKKNAILCGLQSLCEEGRTTEQRNPYFYLNNYEEPHPVFLRGDEGGDIVQVKYNGSFKLCTRATMELFGLEWNRDW